MIEVVVLLHISAIGGPKAGLFEVPHSRHLALYRIGREWRGWSGSNSGDACARPISNGRSGRRDDDDGE